MNLLFHINVILVFDLSLIYQIGTQYPLSTRQARTQVPKLTCGYMLAWACKSERINALSAACPTAAITSYNSDTALVKLRFRFRHRTTHNTGGFSRNVMSAPFPCKVL